MQWLKNIIIAAMLAMILFQTFATVGFIVQFQINRSYYADVLCINKNRPELACHGKCVLMQHLQRDFEQEQNSERQTLQNLLDRELTLFCPDFKLSVVRHTLSDIPTPILSPFYAKNFITRCALSDIFHPPAHRA